VPGASNKYLKIRSKYVLPVLKNVTGDNLYKFTIELKLAKSCHIHLPRCVVNLTDNLSLPLVAFSGPPQMGGRNPTSNPSTQHDSNATLFIFHAVAPANNVIKFATTSYFQ
jgi:hypothetical protein